MTNFRYDSALSKLWSRAVNCEGPESFDMIFPRLKCAVWSVHAFPGNGPSLAKAHPKVVRVAAAVVDGVVTHGDALGRADNDRVVAVVDAVSCDGDVVVPGVLGGQLRGIDAGDKDAGASGVDKVAASTSPSTEHQRQ